MIKVNFHKDEYSDNSYLLGVGGYRHHKTHNWKGFTLLFKIWNRELSINIIYKNFKEYMRVIEEKK